MPADGRRQCVGYRGLVKVPPLPLRVVSVPLSEAFLGTVTLHRDRLSEGRVVPLSLSQTVEVTGMVVLRDACPFDDPGRTNTRRTPKVCRNAVSTRWVPPQNMEGSGVSREPIKTPPHFSPRGDIVRRTSTCLASFQA